MRGACLLHHLGHADALEAALAEQPPGRVQQALRFCSACCLLTFIALAPIGKIALRSYIATII